MKIFVALLCVSAFTSKMLTENKWMPTNTELPSIQETVLDVNYQGTTLVLKNKDQEMNFSVDLSYDDVLIPNQTKWDWGVQCDQENKDCQMTTQVVKGNYQVDSYSGLRGSLTLKLFKDQVDPKEKLNFVNVSEKVLSWKPEKWAVLGMSPKSNFINYLRANTDKDFTMSLKSKIAKTEGRNFEMET